jgi:signal transduction histidine kinase
MDIDSHQPYSQSQQLQARFEKKSWDAANYVYWGVLSVCLALFIVEFFLTKSLWQTTFAFKVFLVAFGFLSYYKLKNLLKSPEILVLSYLILFTIYCLSIIHQESGFIVSFYFCLLTLVLSVSNYLMLWNSFYSFLEVFAAVLLFTLFEYFGDFAHTWEHLALGGYAFFLFILTTSFIPDARKRNYILNLDRDLKKQAVIEKLSAELSNLQLQKEELLQRKKIDKEKEKIFRHDLKNKINNIIGLSQLINGSGLNEEDQTYIHLLKDVSTDLLKYADNLYHKNQSDFTVPVKITLEPVNLFALLKKTKDEIQAKLETKGIELILPKTEINTYITADFLVMNNILENIFNYLIRWSEAGKSINVSIAKDSQHSRLEIYASSTQITAQELNNFFKPIENFEFNSSFEAPKGLGLQIAKNMTEKIGGYFKYQKELTGGITFKLEFETTQLQEL